MKQGVNLFGTPLTEEDFKKNKVLTISDTPRLEYAWDTGVAIGRYFEGLKEGKLLATKCKKCTRIMIPPRIFCELCFRDIDEWVCVKDTGRINTYSICWISWDMKRLKKPQIPAVIEIDGASRGMGILHLVRADPKKVKVGMRVKAVWKPTNQRRGSITDIKYFEPLK